MLAPSNLKSTNNSRSQPNFPNPTDIDNVTDSRSMFVPNNNISPNWNKEVKMKLPLPSQYRSSSLILAPYANQRTTIDEAIEHELKHGRRKLGPNMDRKHLRRTISNRLSAQRCRMQKSQYINDMEKRVKDLEDMISVLTPQRESYEEQKKQLLLQNESLQKLVEIRFNESRISEFELEQKQLEVCRLKGELALTMNNHSRHESSFALAQLEIEMAPTFVIENPGTDQQQGFMTEQPIDVMEQEKVEEEEEIDKYLNFDELNVLN